MSATARAMVTGQSLLGSSTGGKAVESLQRVRSQLRDLGLEHSLSKRHGDCRVEIINPSGLRSGVLSTPTEMSTHMEGSISPRNQNSAATSCGACTSENSAMEVNVGCAERAIS